MKALFLDIDGVLNHQVFYMRRDEEEHLKSLPYPLCEFDPISVGCLNRILDVTGAKLVLSSSWRFDEGLENIFREAGITHGIYDVTPAVPNAHKGTEIQQFLDRHPEITSYAILDDDSNMLPSQMENFVHTSWYDGLTEELACKAIRILNKENDSPLKNKEND